MIFLVEHFELAGLLLGSKNIVNRNRFSFFNRVLMSTISLQSLKSREMFLLFMTSLLDSASSIMNE